jgi:hypothetical protein
VEAEKADVKIAPMITEFFECACHSDEHTLKFSYDPDSVEIYSSVFLHQYRNIFKRLWVALKYVFGYRCKYGHWDCFIMRPEDASRLRSLLDRMVEDAAGKPA